MPAVIQTEGLTKQYADVKALAGIDLVVPTGEMVGFLGPNGAGKSTAIRILIGLLRPTSGRAMVLGRNVATEGTTIRRDVGYLPGDVRFYEWMTGAGFLQFADRARGGGCRAEINRLRERFDINLKRKIRDYSRGMKQKLGLIQALMHQPALLILDEPTTALDPLVQQVLYEELQAHARAGRTVLFSSHTLSEVEALCDRVVIIRGGKIIEDSTISELQQRAVRHVSFRLRHSSPTAGNFPTGLTTQSQNDGVIAGTWIGPIQGLISWLAGQDVIDAAIERPSLEDLFTTYYRADNGQGTSRSGGGVL